MPSQFTLTMNDYDADPSSMSVNSVALTGTNIAAQVALWDTLIAATEAISTGELITDTTSIIRRSGNSKTPSAVNSAKRGNKWLVSYSDITVDFGGTPVVENPGFGKLFQVEIPIAAISFRDEHSDIVYTADEGGVGTNAALFEAWVAAFEALALSPYNGTVEVQEIRAVTINLS